MGEAKRRGTQEQRAQQAIERDEQKRKIAAQRLEQLKQAAANREHAMKDQQRQIVTGKNRLAHLALASAIAIGMSSPVPVINRTVLKR